MSKSTTTTKSYLRIGQIAERSGVSAKALRLYEQRGLLKPCAHSEAGYRLYGPDALRRLMQIVVLKRGGFSLTEIGQLLARDATAAVHLLAARIERLERDVADRSRALETLRRMARRVDSASTLDLDQLLESITMTGTVDMHFTEAQREQFRQRAEKFRGYFTPEEYEGFRQRTEQAAAAGIPASFHAWQELKTQIRAAMEAGTPASDPEAAGLARRWHELVMTSLGGDPGLVAKLREAYVQNPELMAEQGLNPAMIDYMGSAMAAVGLSLVR